MLYIGLISFNGTIRAAPLRVRGVVVVGVASGVDVPRIVRIASIGRTQTAILSLIYVRILKQGCKSLFIRIMPRLDKNLCVFRQPSPVFNSLGGQVKYWLCE